jgi:hypothetical protein
VLPGITREVMKTSKIGARVAYFHKKSPFENKHISALAGWIEEKWRALVGSKSSSSKFVDSPSPRVDSPKEQANPTEKTEQRSFKSNNFNQKTSKVIENGPRKFRPEATTSKSKEDSSREKSNGKERAKSSDTTAAKPTKPKDPLSSRQSKSAGHLKALLSELSVHCEESVRRRRADLLIVRYQQAAICVARIVWPSMVLRSAWATPTTGVRGGRRWSWRMCRSA